MAKKKPEFPQVLFVRRDPCDPGEPDLLLAEEDLAAHATANGKIRVAIYELAEVGYVSADPCFESD